MTDINKVIGERVRFYRTTRKMTMEKLAEQLAVPISPTQLHKYETGVSRWSADLVCDIAMIFRLDVRLLLGMEDGKHEGKSTEEWDAERYKCIILTLPVKVRGVIYRIIDSIKTL